MPRPVTKRVRAERRARAEERQAAYDALPLAERLERAGGERERTRIRRQIEKESKRSA